MIKKAGLNLLVDLLTGGAFLLMAGTGFVLWFALPPGTNRTHALWGLSRHDWGTLHAASSLGLLVLVGVHVALHWKWLVTNVCKRLGAGSWREQRPLAASVSVLVAILVPVALFAATTVRGVQRLATPRHPEDSNSRSEAARSEPAEATGTELLHLRVQAHAVLIARCASCHGEDRQAGGVRADSPGVLLTEQDSVRWAIAGDPERSPLFTVIGPPGAAHVGIRGHQAPESELETLRLWIASEPARTAE